MLFADVSHRQLSGDFCLLMLLLHFVLILPVRLIDCRWRVLPDDCQLIILLL
jgi:hypothetical protein